MTVDALIEALSADVRPVPPGAVQRRLALAAGAGAMAALLLLLGVIGVRPDLTEAASGGLFWAKAGYTFSLGTVGLLLAAQLARPDSTKIDGAWLAAVPVALLALASLNELAGLSSGAGQLIIEPRWISVPVILALATPIYASLLWAILSFAPTRFWAAGAAAGLAAGGLAATVYGLYCQQLSPTYVLTRYSVAIGFAAVIGGLTGRRLLRW